MRIVFMGTPPIAEAALVALLREGHEVAAVYTREDKPVGRKQVVTPPPVKVRAQENGIPVLQPKTLRTPGAAAELAAFAPELCVVVAYGRILPPAVLAVPTHGCINLHVSLLPKYRGAAPIQWAVINGEKETGVSIMQLDEGLDTGPVFSQRRVEIGLEDTAGMVFERVTAIGAQLLVETVADIAAGRAVAIPQQGEATQAPPLTKEDGRLDFSMEPGAVHDRIRGCNPWPLAFFESGGKRVKVLQSRHSDAVGAPGEVLFTSPLTVGFGGGALQLLQVHPEGSRAMAGDEWAAGRRLKAGDNLKGLDT